MTQSDNLRKVEKFKLMLNLKGYRIYTKEYEVDGKTEIIGKIVTEEYLNSFGNVKVPDELLNKSGQFRYFSWQPTYAEVEQGLMRRWYEDPIQVGNGRED